MSKLIIVGDTHFRSKSPFYESQLDFIEWFLSQEFNNENNTVFFEGDISDNCIPDPITNDLIISFFNRMKFKRRIVQQGNHEFSRSIKQTALEILKSLNKEVEIIDFIKQIDIDGLKCLTLPYFYPSQTQERNITNIYTFYNNLPKEYYSLKFDYIFAHLENENQNFGNGRFVDTSKFQGRKIMGHIHLISLEYIGVPVISRYDEKGQKCRIIEIDIDTKKERNIEVPRFLDYVDIQYPNDLDFQNIKYPIFSISNYQDKDASLRYYQNKYPEKKLFFRWNNKKRKSQDIENIENEENSKSIDEYFFEYIESLKKDKDFKDSCLNYYSNNG